MQLYTWFCESNYHESTYPRLTLDIFPFLVADKTFSSLSDHAPIYLVDGQGRNFWPMVRQLPMKAGWWDALLTLQDFTTHLRIYYLISPKQIICSLCGKWFWDNGWILQSTNHYTIVTHLTKAYTQNLIPVVTPCCHFTPLE